MCALNRDSKRPTTTLEGSLYEARLRITTITFVLAGVVDAHFA